MALRNIKQWITPAIVSSALICFLLPNVGTCGPLPSAVGLQNASNPSPEVIILNMVNLGMEKMFAEEAAYFDEHQALPPADHFLQRFRSPSPLNFITNDAKGGILLEFSQQNVPDALKGKHIRYVIPSPPNFATKIVVTDIGLNNEATPFLQFKQPNFTPSQLFSGSNFPKTFTAPTGAVKSMGYDQLATITSSASSNYGAVGTSSRTTASTIQSL